VSEQEGDIFRALENFSEAVAMLTGVKNQFIEQGWSPHAAEMGAIALLQVMHNGNAG
jgi:hypothetical protein